MNNNENLFGKTLSQIEELAKEFGLKSYNAKQIASWLYKKRVKHIDEMTNLSLQVRQQLSEKFEVKNQLAVKVSVSSDGTKKYLFPTAKNKYIESAYIPDNERHTLCVSSQIGCKMGCVICATGRQGFQGQLSTSEILNQIVSIDESLLLTIIVYMGMCEPFDNWPNVSQSLEILCSEWGFGWSPRRITVSTIGIIPGMKEFIEKSQCHLAVSLHSPFENERAELMPVQSRYSLKEILSTIKNYDFGRQRRISFEYIVFDGLNDSTKHINELAKILSGIRCRINLIRFHEIPGSKWKSPSFEKIKAFNTQLNQKGILTTLRSSRGQDIEAACGLLSTTMLKNQ